ncbi:MAG: hypothetical protein DMG42_25115, partial [Acidobacteria bacterium]
LRQERRLLRQNPPVQQQARHDPKAHSFHRVSFRARILFLILGFSRSISCFFRFGVASQPAGNFPEISWPRPSYHE